MYLINFKLLILDFLKIYSLTSLTNLFCLNSLIFKIVIAMDLQVH